MRNITPSYLWVTNMENYKIIMKRTIGVIAIIILGIIILSSFTTLVKTTNVNSYYTIPKELTERVKEIIAKVGATSMKDMGAVMKEAKAELGVTADGRMINEVVKKLLA